MRNTNITNTIANVKRFSVRVNEMLCALAAPQQHWHLQPCVGKVSGRNVTGHYRRGDSAIDSSALATDIAGSLLPTIFERTCKLPGKPASPVLFQRMS